jgi:polyisoprenoid-binding protein YceI
MKNICIIILFLSILTNAQEKYLTKNGLVNFEASVPSFEEVAATNNSVTAILNINTNEFAALVLVKAFRFKNALMEEHFNENYAESFDFPKATFTGTIKDFKMNGNTENYLLSGNLTFHGVTKPIDNIPINIIVNDKTIRMTGSFSVKVSDYNIEIPKIVSSKVSKDVEIKFQFNLNEK